MIENIGSRFQLLLEIDHYYHLTKLRADRVHRKVSFCFGVEMLLLFTTATLANVKVCGFGQDIVLYVHTVVKHPFLIQNQFLKADFIFSTEFKLELEQKASERISKRKLMEWDRKVLCHLSLPSQFTGDKVL